MLYEETTQINQQICWGKLPGGSENALTPDFTVSLRCGLIGQNKAPAS